MTDKEFEKAMLKCGKDLLRYLNSLGTIEAEYQERYGVHPSEVSNDFWIDTFHGPPGGAGATVKEIEDSAKLYNKKR